MDSSPSPSSGAKTPLARLSLTGKLSVEVVGEDVGYYNRVAPYLALGLGNPLRGRAGLEFEVGALYAGQPKMKMTATEESLLSPTAAEQGPKLEEGFKSFRFYPVVSVGLSFGVGKLRH